MSWVALLDLIRAEAGEDLAARIEARCRRELAGVRITVCARVPLNGQDVHAVAPGKPQEAAKILGVDVSTAYRAVWRSRIIR
jgi:hypothetical protein